MNYKIIYNKEQNNITVMIKGEFALATLKELAADVIKSVEKYDCNYILNDMRQAELTRDIIDIYNMPKIASQAGIGPRVKRALVVSEHSSDFHFLETVFLNQGHNVKLFTNIDEAVRWLQGTEKPKNTTSD